MGRPVATDGHLPRLRHAHASWLLAGGADLQTVRERLGHHSLRATEEYLHTVPTTTDVGLEALTGVRAQQPDQRKAMANKPDQ